MELAQALSEALERLVAAGRVEVRENGAWLAALEGFRYELRQHGDVLLLHLWSGSATWFAACSEWMRTVAAAWPSRLRG